MLYDIPQKKNKSAKVAMVSGNVNTGGDFIGRDQTSSSGS
jgi:hypothetical protein